MFAKVVIFCAALAAAQATLVGPLGHGAAIGALGYGRGLIGAPAVAVGATQSAVINHAAPVGIRAVAPLGLVAPAAAGLGYGRGIIGAPAVAGLGYGRGLVGAPAVAVGATQSAVINHVAPVGIRAAAPLGLAVPAVAGLGYGRGIIGAPAVAGLGYGRGLVGAPAVAGLGYGRGLIGAPAVAVGATQSAVINHAAPVGIRAAVPLAYAGNGILSNGIVGNGLIGNGLIANGIVGNGHLGVPVTGLGLGKSIL